ncbi:MAG: antibiotic biosynthesis monooxygenase [Pseudomonadota bacterium]
MILRIFEVRAREGKTETLRRKLEDTSVSVVEGHRGNHGHLFGDELSPDGRDLVFISLWEDMDAVQARFGEHWDQSYLPAGYAELIESHSLKHFRVRGRVDADALASLALASSG